METVLLFLILAIGFYTAWNIGANDVANAMGTSVGSGALTLRRAVLIAAVLEFSGAFFFGSHVSATIQSGIINPDFFVDNPRILVYGMLASLASAGVWLQVASYFGWPVSTTHTIVGALLGFGIVVGGYEAVYWKDVGYIVSSWILSPILGGILGFSIFTFIRKQIFYTSDPVAAARHWAPFMVFAVSLVLSLIFVFEGLKHYLADVPQLMKWILCIAISLVCWGISYVVVRRIKMRKKEHVSSSLPGPEVLVALSKVQKELQKMQNITKGEFQYTIGLIQEEVEQLSNSMQQKPEATVVHPEYVKVEKIFSGLQIMSACMMAFAHGANDVANAIGPLSAAYAILTTGIMAVEMPVPTWALALGGVGIVVGLATWGWRVIETIGKKITELTPSRGFAAEFGAALTIVLASRLGMPISTTHTLVGAVLGVGFARGLGSINLKTTRNIIISWIITVPLGALIAVLLYFPIKTIFGS